MIEVNVKVPVYSIQVNKYKEVSPSESPLAWDIATNGMHVDISNVILSEDQEAKLANTFPRTDDLVIISIGDVEATVKGDELILAIENAMNTKSAYVPSKPYRPYHNKWE